MTAPDDEGFASDSLIGHLVELRHRLLRGIICLVLVFLALVPFASRLYEWLSKPLMANMPTGGHPVAIDVLTPFLTPMKLTFFAAIMLSMPFLIYQAWAFVAPGLYKHEKRLALPLLGSAMILFYAGCAFAYYLVLPAVFVMTQRFLPEGVLPMTDISRYLDFAVVLFMAFGVSFELPVAVVVLVLLGIAAWRWHRRRRLQRWQRWFDAVPQGRAPAEQVAAASDLLRRAARRVSPGADRLEGEAWLRFLDGEQGRAFSEGPGRLLQDGGYRRTVETSELEAALAVARVRFLELMVAKR